MNTKINEFARVQGEGFLHSFSQVFFSLHPFLALILVLVSYMDLYAGISGTLSVLTSNIFAWSMGFNRWYIRKGYYGYNSLLVGLGFGLTFNPGLTFFILVLVASIFTFLLTIAFQGFFYKYALPWLSIPFLLGIWVIMIASPEFSALGLSVRGIYKLNELFALGGNYLVNVHDWFDKLILWQPLRTYLFSLGAIFFQYNLLAGILIAVGIIVWSRIGFTLSLIGFSLAMIFYQITGADLNTLNYSYIGFNYILTSIALGGFFIIPSRWSYLWLVILLPLVIMVTLSLQKLFTQFHLSVYALPFNLVTILFLYTLKIRVYPGKKLTETPVQHFSPEKNLYQLRINNQRLPSAGSIHVALPVMGEWFVSQGHHDEVTHRGEWAHAFDLVVTGPAGLQYRNQGNYLQDYYCFEKPVVAAAAGIVADVMDGIPDNSVGDSNIHKNWGNSVVLKHAEHLYTQVSHLKCNSIKVKKGDVVKSGDLLGLCGNSGRSPYPHLHFQIQGTPFIGSKTIGYPVSEYIKVQEDRLSLITCSVPLKGEKIFSPVNHVLPEKAFSFLPGEKICFQVHETSVSYLKGLHSWEVKTDEYNHSYIECLRTGAKAWFYNSGKIHYFINYTGTKKTLLYYFYLAAYKILTGYYEGLTVTDHIPPDQVYSHAKLFMQDFIAPFYIFLKSGYEVTYSRMKEGFSESEAILVAMVNKGNNNPFRFVIHLADRRIREFSCANKKNTFQALWVES